MKQLCGKATKKPVEIDWFHWKRYSEPHIHELEAWIESFGTSFRESIFIKDNYIMINTLEGHSYAVPDNYIIIRGVQGEFYPCEISIFNATYNVL